MDIPKGHFFKGQFLHLIATVILIWICYILSVYLEGSQGEYLGISSMNWLKITMLFAIIHQVYVWLIWRLELCYGSISKTFGDKSFKLYKFFFAVLILSRPISLLGLGLSDIGSLNMNQGLQITLLILMVPPWIFSMYSVARFFTMDRAFGIDHWQPDKYKNMGMVKGGIFNYTNNGMYIYGFFIVWIIAVACDSQWALIGAFFQNVYVWIHYHVTERPDIKVIYS